MKKLLALLLVALICGCCSFPSTITSEPPKTEDSMLRSMRLADGSIMIIDVRQADDITKKCTNFCKEFNLTYDAPIKGSLNCMCLKEVNCINDVCSYEQIPLQQKTE
jgi:hypothetical protein